MRVSEQKRQAREFIERWSNRGDEKQDSQQFWMDLLEHVYGVENISEYIRFEDRVQLGHKSFIDAVIPATKVMIEQKGRNHDLNKGIRQSDGTILSPFQQAKRYSNELPLSQKPRWIITCNFHEFYVYDMENPNGEPNIIQLADLEKEFYRLDFLVEQNNEHVQKEMEISIKAGDLVGEIYNALLTQYQNPDDPHSQASINQLCVRLVFCLYAEDAGIFGRVDMFRDYLSQYSTREFRQALIRLFKVLDTPIKDRDPYLVDDYPKLAEFPYVNGGMFADENIEIPPFTDDLRELLLNGASSGFDWSDISPTIFGAVFESTLNPETRRKGGMHYTSIENIHKVIDPLFLDDLKAELAEIKQYKQPKTVINLASQFQAKLASLTFFDPACGSGNFLTETYLSIRKLENEAIKLIYGDQNLLSVDDQIIKVSIHQFYGIEINDFAVSVAKTALWIAESQMMEETKDIIFAEIDFLPLKTYNNIIEGNALQIDWSTIIKPYQLDYIMGNPPFIGARVMSQSQKEDINSIFDSAKGIGNVDYVAGWYKKAADYMMGTTIKAALVSTNSITQGQQPSLIFKPLFERENFQFNFAYRTFRWDSEANDKAHVHVIIIGFSYCKTDKSIYDSNQVIKGIKNINAYLLTAPNLFITSRRKPINTEISEMVFGSMPNDGGNLSKITSSERDELVKQFPEMDNLLLPVLGAQEFLHNQSRYCIWLDGVEPSKWRKINFIRERVESVKLQRENSKRKSTRDLAVTPYLFGEIRQPDSDYLIVPSTTSENRRYIPMGYETPNVIATNALQIIPNATLYEFGILTSNVHMAWMRAVAGRLKSDYRYSAQIVYNNFPWPSPTDQQREKIKQTAQAILDARKLYPDSSLADLYDELTMPAELRKAHQDNDRAVMEAYGMRIGKVLESDCVAQLFKMYEELTK